MKHYLIKILPQEGDLIIAPNTDVYRADIPHTHKAGHAYHCQLISVVLFFPTKVIWLEQTENNTPDDKHYVVKLLH